VTRREDVLVLVDLEESCVGSSLSNHKLI
jgi:hypothetical protein